MVDTTGGLTSEGVEGTSPAADPDTGAVVTEPGATDPEVTSPGVAESRVTDADPTEVDPTEAEDTDTEETDTEADPSVADREAGGGEPEVRGGRLESLGRRVDERLDAIDRVLMSAFRRPGAWLAPPVGDPELDAEPVWVRYLRRPTAGPVTVLVAMIGTYIAVFGSLTWSQQSNFGTFGFDMGLYDQGIWLVSRFKTPFLTIRGLNFFAHHVNIVTLLFVPAYWLGAGPHFLYAVETVWMALGAVPIWLLGRDRIGNAWTALGLSGAFLLYPSLEWINWWHFHPDALIITPLLFAYWLATRKRWGWFWVATGLALSCKEDAALAVFVLGLVIWLKHHERARGLITSAVALVWFFIATRVIIPVANAGRPAFYTSMFPALGNSMTSIVINLVIHPMRWLKPAASRSRWTYYAQLFWPVALLALLELPLLAIAGPQLLVNVTSGDGYTHIIMYHYSSIVIAGVFLATVEACARRGRTASGRRFLVGLVLAASLAANVAWSPSPLGVKFHSGIWAKPEPKDVAVNEAIRIVPSGASTTASYDIDPHMTHRVLIYEFPNPWVTTNWGINNEDPPDPSKVDWLVLDTSLDGSQAPLLKALLVREFQLVFNSDGIIVAHRVAPGIPNDHNWP
jgi:uncharacterized membrane protein